MIIEIEGQLHRKTRAENGLAYWSLWDEASQTGYYLKGPDREATHLFVRLFERWGEGCRVRVTGHIVQGLVPILMMAQVENLDSGHVTSALGTLLEAPSDVMLPGGKKDSPGIPDPGDLSY